MELLLALTLSVLLMVALVNSLQNFGTQLEAVEEQQIDLRLQESLEIMARSVRHGWVVEEPTADVLKVTDAVGGVTFFRRSGDTLLVEHPDGAEGLLVDGIVAFDVSATSTERLRPDTELTRGWQWWGETVEAWEARPIVLEEGTPLALEFSLPSKAPSDVNTVSGVQELAISATLETLSLPLAFALPIADVELYTGDEDDGHGTPKVTICHRSPGNPSKTNTMDVAEPAVSGHLAHGDTLGPCPPANPLNDPANSLLVIELFEGFAPGDGRPRGAALGSVSFPVTSLDASAWAWVPASSLGPEWVVVCHLPPADGADYHTMAVHLDDLAIHLAHGDIMGACGDGEVLADTPVLVYTPPQTSTGLDISSLGALIEPGRAYSMHVSVQGRGSVLLRGTSSGSSALSGVAGNGASIGSYQQLPLRVARDIAGNAVYTQSQVIDVVTLITLEVTDEAGTTLTRSAPVLNQQAAENPWLGAVSGELPQLDLTGQ